MCILVADPLIALVRVGALANFVVLLCPGVLFLAKLKVGQEAALVGELARLAAICIPLLNGRMKPIVVWRAKRVCSPIEGHSDNELVLGAAK